MQNASFQEVLLKAERFCAYQERCRLEVKRKLKELGADETTTNKVITSLEEDDFLNEDRFARLYAGGKFRIKRWGKMKIRAELRMRNIPGTVIEHALDSLDPDEYRKTIGHLAKRKEKEVRSRSPREKVQKVRQFLLSRGFEPELVRKMVGGE